MSFGYSAIVLDQLDLTVDEESWFGIYLKSFIINIITLYNTNKLNTLCSPLLLFFFL